LYISLIEWDGLLTILKKHLPCIMFHMKIKAVSTVNLWLKTHRIDKPPATIHSAHWVTDESEYQSLIARAVIASAIVGYRLQS
jgi:hypothetical protein